ncbi:MAG: TerB family tellurite resistance protein [Parvularculaceae bacterium]
MNGERAACGAFLLVAFADAHFDKREEARFLGGVVNDPAFAAMSAPRLADCYNELRTALERDYDGAQADILAAIRAVRTHGASVAAIKTAARQAVVADRAIKPQEEIVLGRIAAALGIAAAEL